MIQFSVSALDKAPVTLKGREKPEFAGLDKNDLLQVAADITYELTAAKVSGGVLVSGSCRTVVAGSCGRCLCDVQQEICAEGIELFFDVEPAQEELDVSEDIRAELVLEFPMNLLCSDECRGLCHNCGTNLNVSDCACAKKDSGSGDMRWDALDDIKL